MIEKGALRRTALEAGKKPGIGYARTMGTCQKARCTGSEAAVSEQTRGRRRNGIRTALREYGKSPRQIDRFQCALFYKYGEVMMEGYRKSGLLHEISALIETNTSAGTAKAVPPSADIWIQCQESAIKIGNYLETRGDGFIPTVRILEDYCENIYQMSIHFPDEIMYRKLYGKTGKQLEYLQNVIRSDMPQDRNEIVFLPYKASMWDSMESVWKAAVRDENTDAYVIPVPYYDRDSSGNLSTMHYEGDLYPDDVAIKKYDTYDFAKRRPDIIFIHNPYDQCNYVTSVHPFFYSENLKKFTDKLVYIPYFILPETDAEDHAAVEGIKHFCIVPAMFHADQIIVQSEAMRQIYIDTLTEYSGKETRNYWENKISGLGSPKTDKVRYVGKGDVKIPKEWMEIIKKPSGEWKKVLLYNTSVNALLEHGEQMLRKIERVFQNMKDIRGEVALLWRPHPLIEATIRSLRPQLLTAYERLAERYKEERWGIYDDTPDLNRAIALSDGYYGDFSSLAVLYREAGKPIMIQDAAL